MKQQAGIGILLALTTAMCWGALPIAMKQVLEVMEPSTIVFYRFLMASIGLGAILAVKESCRRCVFFVSRAGWCYWR